SRERGSLLPPRGCPPYLHGRHKCGRVGKSEVKFARPVHPAVFVLAVIDNGKQRRHVLYRREGVRIVVNLLVALQIVRLAVTGCEAEGIVHLAYASLWVHRKQVESAIPDGEGPTQRGKRDRAAQICRVFENPQESAQIVDFDPDVEPQGGVLTPPS